MTQSGRVEITLVIENREIVDVIRYDKGEVSDLTSTEKRNFAQSPYGIRPIETIYETQMSSPCYIIIGRKKVPVPC